jgi:dTDP-4-dehydrorhamnose 3,5-epimerase
MEIQRLEIPEVLLLTPRVFADDRGHFFESFNQRVFERAVGRPVTFVQDNQSLSARGVLRGLHYQLAPHAQGKLVRAVAGRIFDVAVDLRRASATFGHWVGAELSAENRTQLWIPEGFGHGFLSLEAGSVVLYKTTDFWHPASERCIRWDDPWIGIRWPDAGPPMLAAKDRAGGLLEHAEVFP